MKSDREEDDELLRVAFAMFADPNLFSDERIDELVEVYSDVEYLPTMSPEKLAAAKQRFMEMLKKVDSEQEAKEPS